MIQNTILKRTRALNISICTKYKPYHTMYKSVNYKYLHIKQGLYKVHKYMITQLASTIAPTAS